ncbi:MAG TPA: hypothetical protein DEB40_01405 [Elusimicrobia bacterium]|nr:hypothetical protein [Elusimicrobiota bacterium]HBT60387.1 hypothetical protein [Elusimicrobiota bacterium]
MDWHPFKIREAGQGAERMNMKKIAIATAAGLVLAGVVRPGPSLGQPGFFADPAAVMEAARANADKVPAPAADRVLAEQVFANPSRYLAQAAAVFKARGYAPGSLREIPRDMKVYVLGKDAPSRAAFAKIKTTITDPSLQSLSLDNPDHSFSFPYRGACFIKLTERAADKRAFIAAWSGIPAEFIERADVSLEGEELGMALHELRHCTQPKGIAVAVGENEADMAFVRAQRLSGHRDLLRHTMHLRALFELNAGIHGSGPIFAPSQTYYTSALSFDAVLRGAGPPGPEAAAQAYALLKNTMAMILSYQAQRAGGFKPNTPHFARVAMAAKSFLDFARERKLENDQEKLAVRAAELYMDGLNCFLPGFANSFESEYGRVDFPR